MTRWLGEGVVLVCDRYLASSIAYGEAQGLDAAWLRDIQRYLPRPDLTILLDIAPETAVQRKAAGRDRYERDLALLSRVRESYRRQAAAGRLAAALNGERPREAVSRDVRQRGRDTDSRGRKRANFARAGVQQHARARLERRARRAHIVHEHDDRTADVPPSSHRERVPDIRVPPRGGKVGLRGGGPDALQRRRAPERKMPRDFGRLVEAPRALSRSMKRNRYHDVGAGKDAAPCAGAAVPPVDAPATPTVVFQRVDDGPQRARRRRRWRGSVRADAGRRLHRGHRPQSQR